MLLLPYALVLMFAARTYALSPISKRVSISENYFPGSLVVNIRELLQDISKSETFRLLNQQLKRTGDGKSPNEEEQWFSVDQSSGIVTLRKALDRDALCGEMTACVVWLKIFLNGKQLLLNLDVVINDVNDNPPSFSRDQITIVLSEDSRIGDVTSLDQFLANDADIGDNSAITYSISANSYFDLVQSSDTSDSARLQLKITQTLDFETHPVIRLILTARDHGTPPLSDSSELVVELTDVNDNDPVFEEQVYHVTLLENLHSDNVIVRVQAHDRDSEASGLIRYLLSPTKNKPQIFELIAVDAVTGDVMLKSTLDREVYSSLEVFVEARDSSLTNQRIGQTRVLIVIEDVNDNAPVIHVDYIVNNKDDQVYVAENTEIGKHVAHVSANDRDLAENGRVHIEKPMVSIKKRLPSVPEPAFNLTNDGFLTISQNLDREQINSYEVTIRACDFGIPQKCASKVLNVVILDENDHTPKIHPSRLRYNIAEDVDVGTVLTTIHAVDEDHFNLPASIETRDGAIEDSPYGDVFYHVIDGDGTFTINYKSGEIALAHSLDREQKNRYQITVRAKDGGRENALQSTCTIEIVIDDVNDNWPQFVKPKKRNDTFYATTAHDHVILKVQAVDYDFGDNGSITYTITSEDGGSILGGSLFQLHPTTGELRLNYSNPRLNNSLGPHKVVIQASDKGPYPLYSTQVLDIIITNVEVLPSNDVGNLKMASPPALFFVIISVTSSLLVLIIIILIAVVKCRTDRKQSRSYTCGVDPAAESDWALNSLTRARSSSDSKAIGIPNGNDVELLPSEKRTESLITRSSLNPLAIDKESVLSNRSKDFHCSQPEIRVPAMKYPPTTLSQKYLAPYRLAAMTSSHDGDSGRGDSDPDTHYSDVTNEGSHRQPQTALPINIRSQQPKNSRCTDQCVIYGHSDACWMPNSPNPEQRQTIVHPPWVKRVASTAPSPSSINFPPSRPESRQFDLVPGSIPHRHGWNYPSNNLNAIYSDIVMNTQRTPETNYTRMETRNICQDYVTDDVGPQRPLDHCLPTLPTTSSPYAYQTLMGPCSSLRRSSANGDTEKRLSASFLLASSSQSPLARSSSMDFLSSESLRAAPSREEFRKIHSPESKDAKKNVGEVTMEETQEIIENIEKLLSS